MHGHVGVLPAWPGTVRHFRRMSDLMAPVKRGTAEGIAEYSLRHAARRVRAWQNLQPGSEITYGAAISARQPLVGCQAYPRGRWPCPSPLLATCPQSENSVSHVLLYFTYPDKEGEEEASVDPAPAGDRRRNCRAGRGPRPDVAPAGGDEGITLLFGDPDWKPCEGRVSCRLPGVGAYRVQAGEHDTGSLATVPAVTVAAHHASRERDPESAAAEAGRWPGEAA
jgi:hypothetical protein